MPYISPALSPAKAFTPTLPYPSPPGSPQQQHHGISSKSRISSRDRSSSLTGSSSSMSPSSSPTSSRGPSASSSPMHSRSASLSAAAAQELAATYAAHCAPHTAYAVQPVHSYTHLSALGDQLMSSSDDPLLASSALASPQLHRPKQSYQQLGDNLSSHAMNPSRSTSSQGSVASSNGSNEYVGTSSRGGSSSSKRKAAVNFSSVYANGFPASPVDDDDVTTPQASSSANPLLSLGGARRPAHRHHSRSHSSDTLVSMSSAGSSHKQTPDYVFSVHPASPPTNVHTSSSTGSLSRLGGSSSRPALRSASSSRLNLISYPGSPPNNAGDLGDVAPPRTAKSRKSRLANALSPASMSQPLPSHQQGGSEASTSSSPTTNTSSSSSSIASMASSSGTAMTTPASGEPSSSVYTMPLPDLNAMSPPAFANRSSSSPTLSSLAMENQGSREGNTRLFPTTSGHPYLGNAKGSPAPSPRHSPSLVIPLGGAARNQNSNLSSSSLSSISSLGSQSSSLRAAYAQQHEAGWATANDENAQDGEQTPRAEEVLYNPYSDGSLPQPRSQNSSSTSLSSQDGTNGDGYGYPQRYIKATDLAANDSALATSSESPSSASSDAGSGSEDENGAPKHLETKLKRTFPGLFSASSNTTVTQSSANGRRASQQGWGADAGAAAMGSPASFSFATGQSRSSDGSSSPSRQTNGNGTDSETEREREAPAAGVAAYAAASGIPTSGPLAPGTSYRIKRPQTVKAYSEQRSNSNSGGSGSERGSGSDRSSSKHAFRLELEDGESRSSKHAFPSSVHGQSISEGGPRGRLAGGASKHRPSPLPTPMLRKKSGELVKSSLKHDSRARSAPTTPTGPKAVHFDEQLERVKLFLAQQRPLAVSRDGSPVETETEDDSEAAFPFPPMTTSIPAQIQLVLTDFPKNQLPEIGYRDLCLESLEIAADSKSLKGTALLRNISFEKRLSIRFTFDEWQTVSEVTGEWTSTLVGGSIDRWAFTIKLQDMLARIEEKKMFIALRYSVAGRDIWDNNNGNNYRAEFRKQAARSQAVVGGSRAARHEWSVTNSGQASERMNDLRRELDRLVAEQDDFGSGDEIVLNRGLRRYIGQEALPVAQPPAVSTFASRYDFGASLKEAQRGSPQTAHAILDNPYFAAPNPSAVNENAAAWKASPPQSQTVSGNSSPPKPTYSNLYADASIPSIANSTIASTGMSLVNGMPASASVSPGDVSLASTPPAASFSGSNYYARTEQNGVIATDYAHPNAMGVFTGSLGGANGNDEVSPSDVLVSPASDGSSVLSEGTTPPAASLLGGEPLSRQARFHSFPPSRSPIPVGTSRIAAKEAVSLLEPSLDTDPLDTSIYSPAMSPTSSVSPIDSPQRRGSPEPRSASPDDLLSPSHSSASTDTSISTPMSPEGSPPRIYPSIDSGRPDMASDAYFNIVHRYCWGNGETLTSPSQASTTSSGSTALGLQGIPSGLGAFDISTPRGSTPCSSSLLASPTHSQQGSRTPSPTHGSPALDNGLWSPPPLQA